MNQKKELFGFITVRSSSSRLPRKCFLEFGNGTVIDHVIQRAKHFGITPVICTTDLPEDQKIEDIATSHKALCFRGSEQDKLRRWNDTCEQFGIDVFHTIDADDPFFDPDLAWQSMDLLARSEMDAIYPSEDTYFASVGFSLTASIIKKACKAKTALDTEMMWYFLEEVPGFRHMSLQVPDAKIRNLRLTLDYEEDYWLLRTVLRVLGPYAKRGAIEALFSNNPELYLTNWFRNEQWEKHQLAKKIS